MVEAKRSNNDTVHTSFDYEERDIGQGFVDYNPQSPYIPMLTVLQPLSRACEMGKHKEGDIYSSSFDISYDGSEGICFLPIDFRVGWSEWGDRRRGEGLQGVYTEESSKFRFYKGLPENSGRHLRLVNPATNWELTKSIYLKLLLVEPAPKIIYLFEFAVSKYIVADRWLSKLYHYRQSNGQFPPLFAHLTRLVTYKEQGKTGGKYYNIDIKPESSSIGSSLLAPDDPRYLKAKEFYSEKNIQTLFLEEELSEAKDEDDDIPF